MKFMVITDLHQNTSMIPFINKMIDEHDPDAVLFLGDVTEMGNSKQAVEILGAIKGKKYVIPGNCDPRDLPESISSVAIDMHCKATEIGDVYVAGLGGSNITIFNSPFELPEDEIDSKLRPISRKGMLLMTHVPSFGTLDHIPNGMSVGSPAVAKIVEDFKPLVALSGHIHEDIGAITKDGTLYVNPGPAKDGYCAFLTIEDGKATVEMIGPN